MATKPERLISDMRNVRYGEVPHAGPYTEAKVNRGAVFSWDEGRIVHELVHPDGWTYRTRLLEEELVVDASASLATMLFAC
jgi:hypothetical protein